MSSLKGYNGPMTKYVVKLSKFGGQFRLTLPRLLVEVLDWEDVEFVILEDHSTGVVMVRRFIDGQSLRPQVEADRDKIN